MGPAFFQSLKIEVTYSITVSHYRIELLICESLAGG